MTNISRTYASVLMALMSGLVGCGSPPGVVAPVGAAQPPPTAPSDPMDRDTSSPPGATPGAAVVAVVGVVTDRGVECPQLRLDDGRTVTIQGGPLTKGQLPPGTRVSVVGAWLSRTTCQQGQTIGVQDIQILPANPSADAKSIGASVDPTP